MRIAISGFALAAALCAQVLCVHAAMAAESPWGGPIRPPAAEEPMSRDLSAMTVRMCVVELKFCPAPPDVALGSGCTCEFGTGVVRRIGRPPAAR